MTEKQSRELYAAASRELYENIKARLEKLFVNESYNIMFSRMEPFIESENAKWRKNHCAKQMDIEFKWTCETHLNNFAAIKEKDSGKPYNLYGDDGEYNKEVVEFIRSLWRKEKSAIFKRLSYAEDDSNWDKVYEMRFDSIEKQFYKNDYESVKKRIYEKEINRIAGREASKIFGRAFTPSSMLGKANRMAVSLTQPETKTDSNEN